MNNIYLSYCKVCKKETPMRINNISRKRGVKLRCCICSTIKPRYEKINNLKLFKLK